LKIAGNIVKQGESVKAEIRQGVFDSGNDRGKIIKGKGQGGKTPYKKDELKNIRFLKKKFNNKFRLLLCQDLNDGLNRICKGVLHTPRTRSERTYAIPPYRSGEFPHTRHFNLDSALLICSKI
jgi:hypothetical protein